MLFIDYQSWVVLEYQKKRDANALHLYLVRPTPAKLKKVCEVVCNDRYDRKDEQALKAFFGEGSDKVACLKAIDKCGIDSFRPLIKFLKNPNIKTDEKNIALLAWLVDFKPRPFELENNYESPETRSRKPEEPAKRNDETKERTNESPKVSDEETPPTASARRRLIPGFKTVVVILIVALLILLGITINWRGNKRNPTMTEVGPQACMYWTGERYQQVSCSQKFGDTLVIALDSEKITHFKRIIRPDTITLNSIGVVWYVKINGQLEYYTSGGYHPIDPKLRLKPITAFMIRKYVHPN